MSFFSSLYAQIFKFCAVPRSSSGVVLLRELCLVLCLVCLPYPLHLSQNWTPAPKLLLFVTSSTSRSGYLRPWALPNTGLHWTTWLGLIETISCWAEDRHLVFFLNLHKSAWFSNPSHHSQIPVSLILILHLLQHSGSALKT